MKKHAALTSSERRALSYEQTREISSRSLTARCSPLDADRAKC
jgi:hypothetical protein